MSPIPDPSNSQRDARPTPLDYGREPSAASSGWSRARAAVQERIDGFFEFIGIMIVACGGFRQVGLATALACLAGGLGLTIERPYSGTGHLWMMLGGFLLGLLIKLKQGRE